MASKKRKKPKGLEHPANKASEQIFSAGPKDKSTKRSLDAIPARDWRFLAAAVAIVVVAFLLRIYRIGEQELWVDEAGSFYLMTTPNWLRSLLNDNTPPLYYLLLRAWVRAGGYSEAALRLLSAGLGTLFVAALIWVGREFFNIRTGLWSGWFGAIAPIHIYYSQEARAYTLLLLALLLTYVSCWRALKSNALMSWILVVTSALLALYSHYFAIFGLTPAALLFVIWPEKQQVKRFWLRAGGAGVLTGLLFLPWLLLGFVFMPHSLAGILWIQDAWQRTPPLLAIPKSLELFGLGSQAGLLPIAMKQFNYLDFPASLRHLGLVVIFLLGIWVAIPWGEKQLGLPWLARRKAWLWTLLFFPLATLWLVSFYRPLYVAGRYDLVAFPAFIILLGFALAKIQTIKEIGPILACLVALILFIPIGTKLYLYYQVPPLPDAQPTAKLIDANVKNGDVVVFTRLRGLPVLYYLHRLGYQWKEGSCENRATGRRFACRAFPREAEEDPRFYDPDRVLNSSEEARKDVQDFMTTLGPARAFWVAFHSSNFSMGRLEVPTPDSLLVEELERLGFYPTSMSTDEVTDIYRFARW